MNFNTQDFNTDESHDTGHYNSEECTDFLKIILDSELEDSALIEIVETVIDDSYESLSDEQKKSFVSDIIEEHVCECARCEEFHWSEAIYIRNHRFCSYCDQMQDD